MAESANVHGLVYPMAAMVLLTFIVVVMLFRQRTRSVASGLVKPGYFKTYQGAVEPEQSMQLARHFSNLFEAPVLFYLACLTGVVIGITSIGFVVLAWSYVLCRAAHACIHIGRNRIRARVYAYFAGWLVLLMMWTIIVIRVSGA